MSKNPQQQRTLRREVVPTPGIVATDPVALGPAVAPTAPAFPGVDDEATPIHDRLWGSEPFVHLGAEIDAMDAMLAEQFPSWGLDEIAPLPVETMIKDLVARVGEGTAWAIEAEVGQDAWNRKALGLAGEEESDDDTAEPAGPGPAGDADVADPAEGPALVGGDSPGGPDDAQAG